MRYRCLWLLGALVLAVPAAAQPPPPSIWDGSIRLTTHIDPMSQFTICEEQITSFDLAGGATLNSVCNPIDIPFTSSSGARGSFGPEGLVLGSAYRLQGQIDGVTDTLFGHASAKFYDTVTVTGPPGSTGTTGFLSFSFTLDGSTQVTSPSPRVQGWASWGGSGPRLPEGTSTHVLNYPITFGQPSGIGVTLYANVMVFETHLPLGSPFSVDVNYLNTARMTAAQVLDGNGNVISGATLTSAGGVTYPGIAPTIEKFPFSGFFHPVDMGGVLNGVKAGSAIPVKFSLGGDRGLEIFASEYPRSQVIECASTAPLDAIEESATAGESGLSYDPTSETYGYVWKTDKLWAGSCRELQVKFTDGQVRTARFAFSK